MTQTDLFSQEDDRIRDLARFWFHGSDLRLFKLHGGRFFVCSITSKRGGKATLCVDITTSNDLERLIRRIVRWCRASECSGGEI